jgi:hypothetical protein
MSANKFIRKQQPTQSDVHVDRPLTNISIAFLQKAEMFIADRVFPNIPVSKQSDKYFTFPRGMFNRDEMAKRADCTEAAVVGYTVSTDSYYADVWALAHQIGDQRRANSDSPLQPDREAVELLSHKAMIRRERAWAADYFVTGVWTNERAGVASGPTGSQFLRWDVSGSDPVGIVEAAKTTMLNSTGFEPNTLVLSRAVWAALRNHADLKDRVKYTGSNQVPGVVNLQALAQVMDVERILVAKAIHNSAVEGAADSHGAIMGKNALLAYVAPSPGLMTPSAGYTFSWTGLLGSGAQGQRITRLRDDKKKCDHVEIEMAFDQKLVSADLGFFFLDAVS